MKLRESELAVVGSHEARRRDQQQQAQEVDGMPSQGRNGSDGMPSQGRNGDGCPSTPRPAGQLARCDVHAAWCEIGWIRRCLSLKFHFFLPSYTVSHIFVPSNFS